MVNCLKYGCFVYGNSDGGAKCPDDCPDRIPKPEQSASSPVDSQTTGWDSGLERELKDRFQYFFMQTDGTYLFPNSMEGDLLKMTHKLLQGKNPNDRINRPEKLEETMKTNTKRRAFSGKSQCSGSPKFKDGGVIENKLTNRKCKLCGKKVGHEGSVVLCSWCYFQANDGSEPPAQDDGHEDAAFNG